MLITDRRPTIPTETAPESVLDHVIPGADVIVAMANGEPPGLLDLLETHHRELDGIRLHQMHALHARPSIDGQCGDHLRHVSYFLSPVTRPAFWAGACDLVLNHFSEIPLRTATKCSLVLAAASPPDRHGYFSLGTNAEYFAALIGKAPFFLEVNERMPRTQGLNQLHVSQVIRWSRRDAPLVEVPPRMPDERDRAIAAHIVERISDGATLEVGIGAIPNAVLDSLGGHRELGIHTELLSHGVVDLVELGVVTGTRKTLRPNKVATTFALGTQRLYDWMHENSALELLPVDYVNNARTIAREDNFHHGGRPALPVRVGDHGRPLLVLQRRTGRLRPRRHVLGGRSGVHRPALHDLGRPLAHPRAPQRSVRRHHAQEHRRPRGDGVGRRGAARPLDLAASACPRRRRPSDHRDVLEAEARAASLWGA
jgi:Acetyl-CoA hydrolase/transferase C-terminal domain/Acetyl-CoA hydrolase/transferase N-terminal domain